MHKTIAQFLILLMLFSNAVWAVDSDFISSSHTSSSSSQQTADIEHNDSDDGDHCCHGAAHLIGLTSIKSMPTVKIKDSRQSQSVTTLVSFNHLPPTPPPTH